MPKFKVASVSDLKITRDDAATDFTQGVHTGESYVAPMRSWQTRLLACATELGTAAITIVASACSLDYTRCWS